MSDTTQLAADAGSTGGQDLQADPQTGANDAEQDLVAPRITIEAFCLTPDFATAVQAAAKDRRMAKARATVGMGGADIATKRYANVATPNLILVESKETGLPLFKELEALANVCDPDTRVIVAGVSNDVSLYRELMRQGVSEYLVTPCSPMQIIEAVCSVYADPESAPSARLITVYGAKGGVGSSIIAHNLAAQLAEDFDKETILVDLDLEFGTAALDFNVDAKSNVLDALGDLEGLDDVKLTRLLHQQGDKLRLLVSPATINNGARADEESVLGLIDTVRATCEAAVFDLAHGWTPGTRCALRQSDEVVLVATPDLASLRNLKVVVDWLKAERRHDAAPRIVLNQTAVPKRPEIPEKDFVDILEREIDLVLPFDGAVFATAVNNGEMLSQVSGGRRISDKLLELTRLISGREGEKAAAAQKGGFDFKSLIGAVSGRR